MLIQTPQVFRSALLLNAYDQAYDDTFTDDASVIEKLGHPVHLCEGNKENIKITCSDDLLYAQALVRMESPI